MTTCICPDDQQKIPSDKRIYLYEPDAMRREGAINVTDQSKVHIFRSDCPVHGYVVLEETPRGTTVD